VVGGLFLGLEHIFLLVVVVDAGRVVHELENSDLAAALRRRGRRGPRPRVAGALPPLPAGPGCAGSRARGFGGHLLALPLHRHGEGSREWSGGWKRRDLPEEVEGAFNHYGQATFPLR